MSPGGGGNSGIDGPDSDDEAVGTGVEPIVGSTTSTDATKLKGEKQSPGTAVRERTCVSTVHSVSLTEKQMRLWLFPRRPRCVDSWE
jgi:hypothetical protein